MPLTNTQQGRQKVVMDMARAENLTIRQLYMRVATARGQRVVHGTAADIADAPDARPAPPLRGAVRADPRASARPVEGGSVRTSAGW